MDLSSHILIKLKYLMMTKKYVAHFLQILLNQLIKQDAKEIMILLEIFY